MTQSALRPIDEHRLARMQEFYSDVPTGDDIWFVHTVLAQCFLPYRDPKSHHWEKTNGDYGIILTSGPIKDPKEKRMVDVGIPYGAKPRLFQSYICTQAIKQRSRSLLVEPSMSAMMTELGLRVTGGKEGTINRFKDQITRFASCHFTITGPGKHGGEKYVKAPPIESFEVWFPKNPNQTTLWPSEIQLTQKYYDSLIDHAIPYDFRGLRLIQNKPRAQDIYLWMTQRLCRLNKPLLMKWQDLYEMFGGQATFYKFKEKFPADLLAAKTAYPDANMEEHKDGYIFKASPPPISKTKIPVQKPAD